MNEALGILQSAFERPAFYKFTAALGALWVALIHGAPMVFIVTAVVGFWYGVLDTVLGTTEAWRDGTWNRHDMSKFIVKGITYSSYWLMSVAIGEVIDCQIVSSLPHFLYTLPTIIASALMVTEALSCLDHADALMGGRVLGSRILRGLLNRLRQGRDDLMHEIVDGDLIKQKLPSE